MKKCLEKLFKLITSKEEIRVSKNASKPASDYKSSTGIKSENKKVYSIFAEQFLEAPVGVGSGYSMGISCTVCTWKGIPTIDDW